MTMKKLILALTVAAFSIGAFAGDSCCDKEKAAAAAKEKASCPAAGATAKKDAAKKPVESPKGNQANKS
jgi:hypothetical protein